MRSVAVQLTDDGPEFTFGPMDLENPDRGPFLAALLRGNWRERWTGCPLGRVYILPQGLGLRYPWWWGGRRR